ncbi:MAG: hypothetical protein M1292_06435, partial [Bacteroidetes bacterium]|nr:hypothetical protein [Bacteroidota bacterium]
MAEQKLTQKELMDRINAFDERISRIEAMLRSGVRTGALAGVTAHDRFADQNEEFANPLSESKVFEHGLAWIGSSVLLLGMVFTMLYVNNVFGGITAFVLGIAAASLTFFLAGILKKTLTYMAFMFTISAHLLIYFSLLKLHFFTENPV